MGNSAPSCCNCSQDPNLLDLDNKTNQEAPIKNTNLKRHLSGDSNS